MGEGEKINYKGTQIHQHLAVEEGWDGIKDRLLISKCIRKQQNGYSYHIQTLVGDVGIVGSSSHTGDPGRCW